MVGIGSYDAVGYVHMLVLFLFLRYLLYACRFFWKERVVVHDDGPWGKW